MKRKELPFENCNEFTRHNIELERHDYKLVYKSKQISRLFGWG